MLAILNSRTTVEVLPDRERAVKRKKGKNQKERGRNVVSHIGFFSANLCLRISVHRPGSLPHAYYGTAMTQ